MRCARTAAIGTPRSSPTRSGPSQSAPGPRLAQHGRPAITHVTHMAGWPFHTHLTQVHRTAGPWACLAQRAPPGGRRTGWGWAPRSRGGRGPPGGRPPGPAAATSALAWGQRGDASCLRGPDPVRAAGRAFLGNKKFSGNLSLRRWVPHPWDWSLKRFDHNS